MPEPFLNVFHAYGIGQQQAGSTVPEVVKANPSQIVFLQHEGENVE